MIQLTQAAIFREVGAPQEVVDVELGPLGPTDVIVEMQASGVCGSDLHLVQGDWVRARPMVLGHEGAGIVTATGPDVTQVAVGDHVALCWAAPCGACDSCRRGAGQRCLPVRDAISKGTLVDGTTRISRDGEAVYRMATTGSFARHVLVAQESAMRIPGDLAFDQAALLGCAALTGVGAARNAAAIDADTAVVVIGAGGVGQFVVQGARIEGARSILAVDPSPERRALALALGATEAIAPDDLAERSADRPADVAFDAVGAPETTAAALAAVRAGGRAVVVGLPPGSAKVQVDPFELVAREKTLTGSIYGSADPVASLGGLLDLVAEGRLLLEPLLGTRYPLERIDEAVAEATAAAGGRVVIVPEGASS